MYPDYVQIEMPTRYSQADAEWIQEQLLRLPPSLRRKVAQRYAEVMKLNLRLSLFLSGGRTGQGIRPIHGFANL